jgi:hypothetical protein
MTTFVGASRSADTLPFENLSLSEQSQLTVPAVPDWAFILSANLTEKALDENRVDTAYFWLVGTAVGLAALGGGVFAAIGGVYHTQSERDKAKRNSQRPIWQ